MVCVGEMCRRPAGLRASVRLRLAALLQMSACARDVDVVVSLRARRLVSEWPGPRAEPSHQARLIKFSFRSL